MAVERKRVEFYTTDPELIRWLDSFDRGARSAQIVNHLKLAIGITATAQQTASHRTNTPPTSDLPVTLPVPASSTEVTTFDTQTDDAQLQERIDQLEAQVQEIYDTQTNLPDLSVFDDIEAEDVLDSLKYMRDFDHSKLDTVVNLVNTIDLQLLNKVLAAFQDVDDPREAVKQLLFFPEVIETVDKHEEEIDVLQRQLKRLAEGSY